MDRQYDIIVIGAGNGGLSAAASACNRGFKTLLIEQHNLPGGFATSFRRGRFEFEPALHELCDIGEPDAREEVGALIDSYGARVDWVQVPEAYRLIITGENEEKIDAVMPFGRQAYIDKMDEYVPGSRESMEKFFYLADCIMAANAAVAAAGGNADPKVMMKEHPDFLKCANYPTAVVLRKLKMPLKAQKILSAYWCYMGVNMEDLEFGFYASLVHKYIVNAAYIPRYRSHELSVAMDKTIREHGGTILYNTLATKILMENGVPVGVETTHGTFHARHIIPDISPNAVFGDMMDGGKGLPEDHIRAVNARKIGGRGYCCYVGLNKTAEELGVNEYSYFISELSDTVKEQELAGTFREHPMQATICLNHAIPDCSPEGTCIMSFTTFFMKDIWSDVTEKEYTAKKREVAIKLIRDFEKATGTSIMPYIEEIEIASPATLARYAMVPQGAMYAYSCGEGDGLMARLQMLAEDQRVKNIRFASGYGPRLYGYSSPYMGGDMAVTLTMADMKEENYEKV